MPRSLSGSKLKAVLCSAAVSAGALTAGFSGVAGAVVGDPAADGAYAYTAKLAIGDNVRACTGALVDRNWIITAASCFADDPAQPQTLTAGAPKWKTTATVGRTDLTTTTGATTEIVELVPRQDRDLVMARLATPVDGIAPLTLATTAPTAGENLRVPAYGRTKTEWVPLKLHSGVFNVGAVTANAVSTTGTNGASICQGDTGAPALREVNGRTELAAIASRSWQGGCFGSTETRTGATNTRVDDLTAWVKELRFRTADVQAGTHVQIVGSDDALSDSVADYNAGRWTRSWTPMGDSRLLKVDSVAIGDVVHVFAVAGDGHVYGRDGRVGGTWGNWNEVPGGASGVKDISVSARGNLADLMIIGGDGSLYATTGNYDTGAWNPYWDKIGDNHLKAVTSAYYNNSTHVFVINEDDKVYTRSADYGVGWSDWAELPGSLPNVKSISASTHGATIDLAIAGANAFYTTSGHYDTGYWDPQWAKISDNRLKAVTSSTSNNVVHVYAVNEDDKVYGIDADYNAGRWTSWGEVPGDAGGVKAITATSTN
ncbi:trypsin-like serine protease [Kitasatospora sp. NPDC086009]|uniref:trypsin-like serine protease n=1 Tax=unclassified Kitasatospora TaxID=2633591 RepID=UPI0037CB5851